MGSPRRAASCFPPFSCAQISIIHGLFMPLSWRRTIHTSSGWGHNNKVNKDTVKERPLCSRHSSEKQEHSQTDVCPACHSVSGVLRKGEALQPKQAASSVSFEVVEKFHVKTFFFFPLTNKILYLYVMNKTFTLFKPKGKCPLDVTPLLFFPPSHKTDNCSGDFIESIVLLYYY